jgi:hypothetical protein
MKLLTTFGVLAALGMATQAQAACSGPPIYFSGNSAEVEGPIKVKAGTSCFFGVSGIPGAISEVKITQMPKIGKAAVENLRAYYFAKPGYQGEDEFTYTFIGTDQYGGPMRVSFKRKVTVVPSL